MSYVSPDHSRESAKTPAASSERPDRFSRPGWPEIAVGLVVLAVIAFGGGSQLGRLGLDPVVNGLIFTALSGVAGIAGFAAAALLRIRSLSAFGVRRTSWRWLLAGAGVGLLAWVLARLASVAYIGITGDTANVQDVYAGGASGGALSVVLSVVFIAIATPIGEELLFRGVVANVLLRYGPFIGVVSSAVIFALIHGINVALPTALVVGLITAEVFRRSGSIWPGVVVHAVNNAVGFVIALLLAGMG